MHACKHLAIIVSEASLLKRLKITFSLYIIALVDSISRDEGDSPLKQYITNTGISRVRYSITHFKYHHRVLRLISYRMSV